LDWQTYHKQQAYKAIENLYNSNQNQKHIEPFEIREYLQNMTFHYKTGLNNVAEYMASGLPYVTQSVATAGSVSRVTFPFVTNEITVKNNTAGILKVGFTENGVNGTNFFTLPVSGAYSSKTRITDLFVTAQAGSVTYEVVASLTMIPAKEFYVLTGALDIYSGSEAQKLEYQLKGMGYPGIG
jgi:hypothetical protein